MSKPAPVPTTDSSEYWEACNRSELRYQRCNGCGQAQFYPRPACTNCQGEDLAWLQSSGRGAIHSFTIVHRTANRAFDDDIPFVIALIDLDEGYRMMMNVIGDDRLSTTIGRRVRIVFESRAGGQKLPQALLENPS